MTSRQSFAVESWGVRVSLEWSSQAWTEELSRLKLPIWTEIPMEEAEVGFRVEPDLQGAPYVVGPEGPCRLRTYFVDDAERAIHHWLATHAQGAVYLHCGAVEVGGKCLLVPGRSYAGKSTLVYSLVRHGAAYLSDEFAILDAAGLAHPFPRPISIRAGDRICQRYAATDLGWSGEVLPTRPSHIVFSTYHAGGRMKLQRLSKGAALLKTLENIVSASLQPELALSCALKAVQGADCWSLERGESDVSASLLLDLIAQSDGSG